MAGGGGSRISTPAHARQLIANMKDFGCNHGDEEIFAMLKECAMDPNEAAQRLLLQDPFLEVKTKREKRKENVREPAGPRWRPGVQGRGGRGGHGSYSSHGAFIDDSGGRAASGKVNGPNQGPGLLPDKGSASSVVVEEMEGKLTSSKTSSASGMVNDPNNMEKETSSQSLKEENHAAETIKRPSKLFSNDVKASDPVLVPSLDAHSTSKIGIIKRAVGSQRISAEAVTRSASEKGLRDGNSSHGHEQTSTKSLGSKGNQLTDTSQIVSPSMASPSSRPSSIYNNHSQQLNTSQKVVPNKEWKPKSIPAMSPQVSEDCTSDSPVVVEAIVQQLSASESKTMDETAKKLEELQLAERHVIIPSHIQVSETEIQQLSFGSFDVSFKMNIAFANGSDSGKSVEPLSDTSQEVKENVEPFSKSIESVTPVTYEAECPVHLQTSSEMPEECPVHLQTSSEMPENISSSENGTNISSGEEHNEGNQKPASGPEGAHFSVVQTAPYSSFGLVPQMIENFDSSETQARDSSQLPSSVVQQPFDPAVSYYAQFYRPTVDADGRFSPSHVPGSSKYNGNISALSARTGQSPREGGNSIVLSATGSTPLTAGAIENSISVPQHPVPVFRHPAGLHLSHYPPSYLPYGQYFSAFFVPPPLHHFVTGSAFPQQSPSGNTFPLPVAAASATPVKYPLAQYKPGNNPGNSTFVGMIPDYGNYNSTSAVSNANSTGGENPNTSQFKENNVYQSEAAPPVWIPIPGRDMSGLQASSFYNIPLQGQHVTFSPSQAAHGGFSSIYHPAPTITTTAVHPLLQQSQNGAGAVEVIGPHAGIYQQPQQRSQINWGNNY